jgi:hypothetical protein
MAGNAAPSVLKLRMHIFICLYVANEGKDILIGSFTLTLSLSHCVYKKVFSPSFTRQIPSVVKNLYYIHGMATERKYKRKRERKRGIVIA